MFLSSFTASPDPVASFPDATDVLLHFIHEAVHLGTSLFTVLKILNKYTGIGLKNCKIWQNKGARTFRFVL